MERFKILNLVIGAILILTSELHAQIGYYDAPYTRYEADLGTLAGGASATAKSYNQSLVQSEASDQICVNLTGSGQSVAWTVSSAGDGLVVRYSVPDGQSGSLDVYSGATFMGTLNLSSYWSWEYLSSNGNPNNAGVTNTNPKMRFDEVRMRLSSQIAAGGTLKLVWKTGNISLDFAELEAVPAAVTASAGDVTYDGSGLQNFINAHGGQTIYLPAGYYSFGSLLWFGSNNTTLKGAGMWYTEIHFTNGSTNQGGLWGQAYNISYSGLYLTTDRNSRSSSYKAINGVYSGGSTITNVWAEHFECGAWIAQYNFGSGPNYSDGFTMSYCRFRDNYADGTNLCEGTSNAIVQHCSYRNNGDDDMAVWPQSGSGQEGQNNTFQYCTSENTWRASGCAIYGGYSNKAYNLLIKDNVEVGIRVNNFFGGYAFNGGGMHVFSNIRIIGCGTFNDLFNSPVGAIDLLVTSNNGNAVNNVKFSCIEIINSKNDAIYVNKTSGSAFNNLVFENIKIDGTGKEYASNGNNGNIHGYGVLFGNNPGGYGTYCGMSYANLGGSVAANTGGSFGWSAAGSCPSGCSLPPMVTPSSTVMTSATTFGVCNFPITLSATTTAPSGNTVSYIEFFVDGASIGKAMSSPYNKTWSPNPSIGSHSVYAVAGYSGGSTSTSLTQSVTVADAVYPTATAPTIDGTIDGLWGGYAAFPLTKLSQGSISGPADLSATFQMTWNASNLFILVNVTDDILRNNGGSNWQKDALELLIDIGNNKSTTYGTSDFQYNFVYNDLTVYETQNNATSGVTFKQGAKTGGYIMEISIPWSTLGGAPAAGSFMGFELGVDDNDNAGTTRDAKIAWSDATDNAWQNPSLFGTLQIGGCTNPLPVGLLSFTGEKMNETVVLNWSTASELNNKKFIVERSDNLSNWEEIGEVLGAGNTTTLVNYNFTDYTPIVGKAYYRLRQVDMNGAFAYSNVVLVEMENQLVSASISPNPFEEDFVIKTNIKNEMDISIYDVLGRLLYHANQKTDNGLLHIFQPDLAGGTYLVTIKTDTFIEQQKIIKK